MSLKIHVISCLYDNFAYLLVCEKTGRTAVVDPGEAQPVLGKLAELKLELSAILATHHHGDHIGGISDLLNVFPDIPVFGHTSDRGRIDGQNRFLEAGDVLEVGAEQARALHVPGHTRGALAYHFEDAVFTGDTLFGGGCGRLFEGTPSMMYHALNKVLGRLPEQTRVYFGHEYTVNNLRFAQTLEPDSEALLSRLRDEEATIDRDTPTTPSNIALERATNPFMRCDSEALRATLRSRYNFLEVDPEAVLAKVRQLKDHF